MANYPGYIISIPLPSKDEVINFTERLIHYLFPVTKDSKAFLLHHETEQQQLRDQLKNLIASVSNGNATSLSNYAEEYFSNLSFPF